MPRPHDCNHILYSLKDNTPLESPVVFPLPAPGKATPPPIDPGIFQNVAMIWRLIDEASELSICASSGLSAVALGSIHTPTEAGMSAMHVHRLRALAVQKLGVTYKADEIASSVMVMQGGSIFDDITEKVLKHDPNNTDARYVHFFHEKIPSWFV
ncbi:hypothetical protein BDR03DRAFT_1014020 [Suillus americanus]|nr:hypothetical protein BDR03DRAFT_1014020 [Suillus americanus]